MNGKNELRQQGLGYMAELSRIYDLDPEILELCEKGDCPVFTSIIPFLDFPIIGDPNGLVDSFGLWTAVTEHTGGWVYYGFSLGDQVALLFVDGNPENWGSDFPKKGEKLRAAVGIQKKNEFVIAYVSVYPHEGILVIDFC